MARVLIVDDSPLVTNMVESYLFQKGYEVTALNTPFGVSNKIREFEPHVILMDLGLPGLSGEKLLDLCNGLASREFRTIVISSKEEAFLKSLVSRGIADDYFVKGAPLNVLAEKINHQVQILSYRERTAT